MQHPALPSSSALLMMLLAAHVQALQRKAYIMQGAHVINIAQPAVNGGPAIISNACKPKIKHAKVLSRAP